MPALDLVGLAEACQYQCSKDLVSFRDRDPGTISPDVHSVFNSHVLLRCHTQLDAAIGIHAHSAPVAPP
eukprot:10742876-Alexandrium_andersonii.AAC.1